VVTAGNTINTLTATTVVTINEEPIAGLAAVNDSPTALGEPTTLTATVTAGDPVAFVSGSRSSSFHSSLWLVSMSGAVVNGLKTPDPVLILDCAARLQGHARVKELFRDLDGGDIEGGEGDQAGHHPGRQRCEAQ